MDGVRGWRFGALRNRKNTYGSPKLEEQVIQKFSYRCPYCDHPITYNELHLRPGENEVKCPSCKKTYIKIVPDSSRKRKKE